ALTAALGLPLPPPPPARRHPSSRRCGLSGLPSFRRFRSGRGGLLQLLGVSLSPCCRYPPRRGEAARQSVCATPCYLRPHSCGLGPRIYPFRGHLAFTCVTARRLAPIPRMGLSMGFRSVGFPPACHPATGVSDSYPGGPNTRWTHQPFLDAQPGGLLPLTGGGLGGSVGHWSILYTRVDPGGGCYQHRAAHFISTPL